jgi:hypothetical protein
LQTKVVKSFFVLALGTDAFYDEVGGIDHKIFGQFHSGDVDVVETVGLSAGLAIDSVVWLKALGAYVWLLWAILVFVADRGHLHLDGVTIVVIILIGDVAIEIIDVVMRTVCVCILHDRTV